MTWIMALLTLHLAPVSPAPSRQPQLAAGNGLVALVFGSGDAVWFAQSADYGRWFTRAMWVADVPKLALGRHRGPRVAIGRKAILVTAIGAAGDVLCWRSGNGGNTWSKGGALNDVHSAREGLHAMAADGEGHVAVVWLDDRTGKGKRLYGVFSNDDGTNWSNDVLLYESPSGSVCECCHPSLAAMGGGEFTVMWRNSLDGSRDLYAMRVRGGKPVSQAIKQGNRTWTLNACPMDGGGLAARGGETWSAWRREKDVYLVEPGKPEMRLGSGDNVALAVNRAGAYVLWSTPGGIWLKSPSEKGHLIAAGGAFPAAFTLEEGTVLAAWEDRDSITIERLQ
jgi:hypothetical protein